MLLDEEDVGSWRSALNIPISATVVELKVVAAKFYIHSYICFFITSMFSIICGSSFTVKNFQNTIKKCFEGYGLSCMWHLLAMAS